MATFNLSGMSNTTTPIGERVDYDAIIKAFPASTVIHLNNTMLVAIIMEKLSMDAVARGKDLYSLKAEGRSMCERVLECNKADEGIFQVYEAAFSRAMDERAIPSNRIAKRFAKMVVATLNTNDVPNMEMKTAIDHVREVVTMKHTVCEELKASPVFATLVKQLFDDDIDALKDITDVSALR